MKRKRIQARDREVMSTLSAKAIYPSAAPRRSYRPDLGDLKTVAFRFTPDQAREVAIALLTLAQDPESLIELTGFRLGHREDSESKRITATAFGPRSANDR